MNAIKYVRDRLGFSQAQMAQCLGVSNALVQHCEAGNRQLTTAAQIRLSNIEMMMNDAQKKVQDKAAAEDKLVNDHYERSRGNPDPKLRSHAGRTAKLYRQFLDMKKKYVAITGQMELTKKLAGKSGKDRTKENVFLDMLEANLAEKLSKVGPTKQLVLRAKVFGRIREYEVLNGEL